MDESETYEFLSFGAGVDSTCILAMHLNINKDDQAANRANNFSPSNDSKMHFLIEDSHSGSKS